MKSYCIIILLPVIFFCTLNAYGQSTHDFRKSSLSLTAGGEGLFGSLKTEFRFTHSYRGLGINMGVGFYTEDEFYLTFPVNLNYLFTLKKERSFLELGFGVTYAAYKVRFSKNFYKAQIAFLPPWNYVPALGYRQYNRQGVYWAIKFSPVLNNNGKDKLWFTPWGGISIGKNLF